MYRILVTTLLISSVYCNDPDSCSNVRDCSIYCLQYPNIDSVECSHDGYCVCYPGKTSERTTPTKLTTPATATLSSTSQNTVMTTAAASQKPPSTRSPMCNYFDATLHQCKDNSACGLPHVHEVICPDPAEVIYCPHTCGCC